MSANTPLQAYGERFNALAAELGTSAPSWLLDMKRAAFDRFADRGFPDPRHEEWKYTNVRPIATKAFADPAASAAELGSDQVNERLFDGLDARLMVFVNGLFRADLSAPGDPAEGVVIQSLAEAIRTTPQRVQSVLSQAASDEYSSFVALNTAFMGDGVLLELAPAAVLDRPLHLLFIATADAEPVACHPRILIHAGAGSEATVIEHYVGQAESAGFTNAVTEILAEANASIRHYLLQDQSQKAYHIGSLFARQHRDSRVLSNNINLGGRLARNDVNVTLAEEGAEAVLNGLFMTQGRQHTDNHTRIHHAAPHTRSEESYRGVADGHGRGVFKGRVLVARDAQKIEAHQNSANLLLSEHAEIDTKPELEIYADDVVCSHGATVGQLEDQSLFYLRSRGIDEETARGILVFAFADEIIERLDLAPIRAQLEQRIVGRLPDSEMLKEFV
jgi:Fe-S cluster assembly protein SufD